MSAYAPPPIAGHVTDAAGKLTATETSYLNDKLSSYRTCSTNHIVVFFPKSLEGNSIEDVAYSTFNTWKVGETKKDNGVLLVLATSERQVRIETGKGVGGQLTDVQSFRILREDVNPNLKAGNFFTAADAATTSIARTLGGCGVADAKPAPLEAHSLASSRDSLPLRGGLTATFVAMVFFALVLRKVKRLTAAGISVASGLAMFALLTFRARTPAGDDLSTILLGGLVLNATAGITLFVVFMARRAERGKKKRRRGKTGGGGDDGGFFSGGGGSDPSSGGGSDYAGGGGSSGGGGASDSY